MKVHCDYLVIGTGIAGLSFASKVAGTGEVVLLTKGTVADSATFQAQGGVATVIDAADSFDAHIRDTMVAGRGLCHEDIVRLCVTEGPTRIRELIEWGTHFTTRKGHPDQLDLGREGGHSARRIVHADDATGKELIRAMHAHIAGLEGVRVFEQHMAVNLIVDDKSRPDSRCLGAYVLDRTTGEVHTFLAPITVLATGGLGKVYLYTSNPDVATGDGLAMGYRVGAQVANMEFYQFHPTILYHPMAKSVLISEAVRGEGGILRDLDGRRFMPDYHPQAELAPRDVVARAIDDVLKRTGHDHVWLDISHKPASFVKERFPNIYATCRQFGIDITAGPIPVVPGAHYSCGGLRTDAWGRTTVPGLYAVGEVACTGLHGANRLASNSLLEGLVFAHQAAQAATAERGQVARGDAPEWDVGDARPSDEHVVVSQDWDEIRRFMWNYVGIVRSNRRLERARRRIDMIADEIREYYWDYMLTPDLVELRNIATVADLIIACAQRRRESRGLHYTIDYPHEDPDCTHDTIVALPRD